MTLFSPGRAPADMRAADRLLLVACAALVLAGPIMSLQEYAHAQETRGLADLVGRDPEAPQAPPSYRATWRLLLLVPTLVVGVLGSLQLLRVARVPRLRAMAGALLPLLVAGMVLLDVAYLADYATDGLDAATRALTVVWGYPLAAAVVALSASRIAELEETFGARERARQDEER